MGVQMLDDHLAGGSDCNVRCVLRYVAILHGLRLLDGLLAAGSRLVIHSTSHSHRGPSAPESHCPRRVEGRRPANRILRGRFPAREQLPLPDFRVVEELALQTLQAAQRDRIADLAAEFLARHPLEKRSGTSNADTTI